MADERIGRLSGGQKRAVDVALGLIGRPELLFLDEPSTGLDPAARREMWATIGELRDAGTTILLTTHYMDEAQHLADRLVILRAGDVVGAGTTTELTAEGGDTAVVTFHLDRPDALAAVAPDLSATPSIDEGAVRLVSSAPRARPLPVTPLGGRRRGRSEGARGRPAHARRHLPAAHLQRRVE